MYTPFVIVTPSAGETKPNCYDNHWAKAAPINSAYTYRYATF
jgi:hypothetical protein